MDERDWMPEEDFPETFPDGDDDTLLPRGEDLDELAELLAPRLNEKLGEICRRRRFG